MKISTMNNEQAADALIRIAGPMSNLCDDEELVAMLDEFSKMGDLGFIRAFGKILPKVTAFALKKHRQDVYEIVGALEMIPAEKVSKMKFVDTVKVIRDSYDDVLKDFFTHSATAGKKTENA